MNKNKSFDTKVIHAGEITPRISGAVTMPIFQSATFEYGAHASYHNIQYIRLNNTPNHTVLHEKVAALENGEAALVSSSGMATISSTLMTFLKNGDHLLAQDCLYGGTHGFITQDLPAMGVTADFIDGNSPKSWKEKLKPNTKVIYVETISNPLLGIPDLKSILQFAKENGLISIIDNTFASPFNFRPLEIGFDLSLHSGTKYLNGHSDIVAGAVIGKARHIEEIKLKLNHLGGSLDPHACFLLHRGIKTLALRMRHQNESALKIARFLKEHPRIAQVHYPGLEIHKQFALAKELLDGFGGMVSFKIKGGLQSAHQFIQKLEIPIHAPSLGGVESLVTRPASTSHSGIPATEREKMGITEDLGRLSVGIESTDDLIEDLKFALQ